jgi:hypothetical protein
MFTYLLLVIEIILDELSMDLRFKVIWAVKMLAMIAAGILLFFIITYLNWSFDVNQLGRR